MKNILYYVAVVMMIAWAIGVIGYGLNGLIHALAILAFLAILIRMIQGGRKL
ncbi:MAG: lmo0937 family membrane protein [Bacteroidales bacterium]